MRRSVTPERVLATVLFTDIVGSTELAVKLGDRRWRDLVAAHHRAVRAQLKRFRGREVDTAGDGFLQPSTVLPKRSPARSPSSSRSGR